MGHVEVRQLDTWFLLYIKGLRTPIADLPQGVMDDKGDGQHDDEANNDADEDVDQLLLLFEG